MTRSQIDRLGESLRRGELDRANLTALASFRNAFITSTSTVASNIAATLGAIKATISQRPAKSTPSIIAKLRRESVRLSQMQDIGGLRVVVSKVATLLQGADRKMIFLITYDRSSGCLVNERQFADADIEAANDARLEAEIAHAGAVEMEVVILKADSREELQETHARYFKTLKELSPT